MLRLAVCSTLALAMPAAAIVCPPESDTGKKGLLEGSKCGGMCNFHGTCAEGLTCKQPATQSSGMLQFGFAVPVLGFQTEGVCSKSARTRFDPEVVEAVTLLN